MIKEQDVIDCAEKIVSIVNNEGIAELKIERWKDGNDHFVLVEQSRKIRAEKIVN